MGSILIGIKRFFQNKNTVTIIAILISLAILYWAYNYRIKRATEPVLVPYATQDIAPRAFITSDMVSTKKVPGGIVDEGTLKSVAEIVGKYVSNTAVIPKNSIFFTDTVTSWDSLPSSLYSNIPDGNTIVALPVTLDTTYGNSIYPGNYIDLYYKTTLSTGKIMIGKFIESINVLAVVDSSGNNIFETIKVETAPAYLIFSVDEETHVLLRKAGYLDGTIFPVPRNAEYSNNPKKTRIVSAVITKHINDQAINLEEIDESLKVNDSTVEVIGGDK